MCEKCIFNQKVVVVFVIDCIMIVLVMFEVSYVPDCNRDIIQMESQKTEKAPDYPRCTPNGKDVAHENLWN